MIWRGFDIEYDTDASVRGDQDGPHVPSGILSIGVDDPDEAQEYLDEEDDWPGGKVEACERLPRPLEDWIEARWYEDIMEAAGEDWATAQWSAYEDAQEAKGDAEREERGAW